MLAEPFALAIDAMGGDQGPQVIVQGIAQAGDQHPSARILLVGDTALLTPLLAANRMAASCCTIRHAPDVIDGNTRVAAALRARGASLRVAIDAVAAGEAAGLVTAGNTAAVLAIAKTVLGTMPGIHRPAIAGILPSQRGTVVLLDLGANLVCDARNLVEFAFMGDGFTRIVLGREAPSLGLLNVGSEQEKGDDRIQRAAEMLRASPMGPQFAGFVEGHDILGGKTDIVVTDGFTGNVAMKMGEGALRFSGLLLRQALTDGLASRLGALLMRPSLKRVRQRIDPWQYNGAVMLGLNGVVVKSRGNTDGKGFSQAVAVGLNMVRNDFNERIRRELELMERPGAPPLDPARDSVPGPPILK